MWLTGVLHKALSLKTTSVQPAPLLQPINGRDAVLEFVPESSSQTKALVLSLGKVKGLFIEVDVIGRGQVTMSD